MYFTREEQIASPEPIQASRNGSVQTRATEQAAAEYDSPLISSMFIGASTNSPGNDATHIFRSAALSSRLNKGVRDVALSRAQRTRGNRFTQQLVSHIQLSSNGRHVVQRECGCGTCAKCSAPTETFTPAEVAPEPRRFLQAKSNGHSAGSGPNGHFVQAETNGEDTAPAVDVREFIPQDFGHPLDETTRADLEARFGADFRGVRVHADDSAAASAVAFGANAFTTGRDIYFGAGQYSPSTQEGKRLLAHELTHVLQQGAGQQPSRTESTGNGEITVGAADDHLEQEADAQAEAVVHGPAVAQEQPATSTVTPETSSEVTSETSNTVQRNEWTWGDNPIVNTASAGVDVVASGVKTGAKAVASGVKQGAQWAISQIEKLAPGAVAFFRNIKDYFKNAINKGLDGLFGGVLSSIRDKGLGATLAEMVGGFASGALRAIGGFIAGYCGAIGQLAEFLLQLQLAYASGVFELVKKGFEAVRDKLDQLWTEYGAPALEFVTKKLKAIWKDVEETAGKIWQALRPLREAVAEVWNAVTDFLAEGKRTYDAWMEGFVNAALDKWEEIKAKIKPYMGYVKTAAKVIGAVVVLFSPAGPFVVAGVAIYGLYVGVKALWDRWGQGFTKSAREWWANEAIPAVQNKLKEFRAKVDAVKQKVSGVLTQLYDAFMQILGALGVLTFLATVKSIFDSITQKIREFKEKLDKKLHEWSQKIKDLISRADPYLQQIKEAFRQTLLVSLLGPFAIMDDGVWGTIKRVVQFVMKTPCLRELGGLFRVPAVMQKIDGFRSNLKAMWKVIQNPDPLLEEIKNAIQPMVAKVEPEVRQRVFSQSLGGGTPAPQASGVSQVGTAPAAATATAAAPAAAQAAPQLTPEQARALKAASEEQERKQLAAQLAQSGMVSEREAYISLSIWHYLSDSLSQLATNWWEELKKIAGDLIWPWPTVQKDWDPMVDHFGKAIDQVFELEFSDAIDQFLKGMKLFNSIAGALSGWFLVAAVLIGAALGALGFVTGPGGFATVGAGAAAGLEVAEAVGMGLLVIALATEAAVLEKASFDLKYQNLRIPNLEQRNEADQQDCKDIAGSLVSIVTLGALFLLADIAARFAKWVYSLVENVPLVKNVTTILRDFKKSVSDLSLVDQPGAARPAGPSARVGPEGGGPRDVAGEPGRTGEPAQAGEPRRPGEPEPAKAAEEAKLSDDAAATAERKGVPREQFEIEVRELNQKAGNPDNIRDPADPRFDAEMDAQGHVYDREKGNRTWCRFSDPACGLDAGGDLNAKVDSAQQAKAREAEALGEPTPKEALEPVDTKPTEPAAPGEPAAGAEAVQKKSARDAAIEATKKKIDELHQKQAENQAGLDRVNREIADATRNVERLKEKVRNSSGEARKRAVEELREAQSQLRDAEGGGLLDERQGYLEEKRKLSERERSLNEALKLERPSLKESTKRAIEAKAQRAPDGRFLDANTGQPIDGVYHYGHKYGFEHRRLALEAQKRGMSQSQFNDWVNNNPDFFQIESEASNLSHKFEKPGID